MGINNHRAFILVDLKRTIAQPIELKFSLGDPESDSNIPRPPVSPVDEDYERRIADERMSRDNPEGEDWFY